MYDLVVIGAGLFGAVFAREAAQNGKKVLVVEKRNHLGGNIYTEEIENIHIHKYGAHIFHTSDKKIWHYIQQFAEFKSFINSPIAKYHNKIYNLPFNMNTFYQLWGISSPSEAMSKIHLERKPYINSEPKNLEEQALSLVGKDIYEKLIKGYTEKQWGRKCQNLPAFIINRLPIRFKFDNNYFEDDFQGIPITGYTKLIENMISSPNIDIKLNYDYFENSEALNNSGKKLLFTGMIDQFYNYEFGKLEYRSLRFKEKKLNQTNFQGNAVVNYTDSKIPYTRIIEHKHFLAQPSKNTIITYEYPLEWSIKAEPFYPINNAINNSTYLKYLNKSKTEKKIIFGGRLGMYKYYNMDQIIKSALELYKKTYF